MRQSLLRYVFRSKRIRSFAWTSWHRRCRLSSSRSGRNWLDRVVVEFLTKEQQETVPPDRMLTRSVEASFMRIVHAFKGPNALAGKILRTHLLRPRKPSQSRYSLPLQSTGTCTIGIVRLPARTHDGTCATLYRPQRPPRIDDFLAQPCERGKHPTTSTMDRTYGKSSPSNHGGARPLNAGNQTNCHIDCKVIRAARFHGLNYNIDRV